ncbi:MAG: aldehyde dehydrogenase family protein [Trueperaceae bacterium]|nr:aldehyde dehydrogenase family protein [Trueperaceae bacterium]
MGVHVNLSKFYIDGRWVTPKGTRTLDVINPATEEPCATITLGNVEDVDIAVAAARRAFETYSLTSREERMALLSRIIEVYDTRLSDLAEAVTMEMGAPSGLALRSHAPSARNHLSAALDVLKDFAFEERIGTTMVVREPIGVCGLITPWNWPLNQLGCKVAPALATGCTMVLKPSEIAPLSAMILAEILHDAGVPKGVFNLINGDGPTVGAAMSSHPDIDMISFTGSTRAGRDVAKRAAESIKRVTQELGGKSANILLDDVDFHDAVTSGVTRCASNSGQSCNAPTRMLVPKDRMDEVAAIATSAAETLHVGDPNDAETTVGPVVSRAQWEKIQHLIDVGVGEGARMVAGGTGTPEGLTRGYYVRPTVFTHVTNDMTIAREEIFGPVLSIIGYDDEDDAVRIANDTRYGLSSYVSSADPERARRVARRIRTGMAHLNGAPGNHAAPFGGYKESGNGREWGRYGFEDYLETKSIFGYWPAE